MYFNLDLFLKYWDYSIEPDSQQSPVPYRLYFKTYDNGINQWIIKNKGNNSGNCLIGKFTYFDGSDENKQE